MEKYKYLIIAAILFTIFNSDNYSQNNNKYLEAAQKTANWLIDIEKIESQSKNVICWPQSNISSIKSYGIDVGAAGISLFFLKLYQVTGDSTYLTKAEGGANFINLYSGSWRGPDWLNGVAGYGHLFLELHKNRVSEGSKSTIYLEYAIKAANWVKAKVSVDNDGYYYWVNPINPTKLYTGFAHGTAGIAMFFLELYEITNNTQYLVYAEKSFGWLKKHTIRFNDSTLGWKRLTDDKTVYHLWCGGTTGIMFFLEKFYVLTGNQEYKEYLIKAANGLVNKAYRRGDKSCWNYSTDGGSFPIAYCHGTSSVAHILFKTYKTTGDGTYLNFARRGMNWLKEVKKEHSDKSYFWAHIYQWEQYDTGFMTGTAGIGYSFVEAYNFDQNIEYLEYATGAADYLVSIANNTTANQYKWINFTSGTVTEPQQYYSGFYSGAAGIGIFLLHLHETLNAVVSVKHESNQYITEYSLKQNYPNPFNPTTTITFTLPEQVYVKLKVYNLLGKEVMTLVAAEKPSGTYNVEFDASQLPSGMYIYRIQTDGFTESKKLLLIK